MELQVAVIQQDACTDGYLGWERGVVQGCNTQSRNHIAIGQYEFVSLGEDHSTLGQQTDTDLRAL